MTIGVAKFEMSTPVYQIGKDGEWIGTVHDIGYENWFILGLYMDTKMEMKQFSEGGLDAAIKYLCNKVIKVDP